MTYPAILKRATIPGGRGTLPSAIVLRDFGPGADDRYVTHHRNESGDASLDGYYWGHYFASYIDAEIDFDDRVARYARYGAQRVAVDAPPAGVVA